MFDIGFWEMAFIGVVALVVIGPEKLPGVARTVGHLVGKGRRMLNEAKSDIRREIREHDLQDLKDLKQELGSVTSDIKKVTDNRDVLGVKKAGDEFRKSVDDVAADLKGAGAEIEAAGKATGKKTAKKAAAKKTAAKKAAAKEGSGQKDHGKENNSQESNCKESSVEKASDQKGGSQENSVQKSTGKEETGRFGKDNGRGGYHGRDGKHRISPAFNQRINTGDGGY